MSNVILKRDTYHQIKSMLESSDEENAVVALTIIENSNFRDNLTYILLLMKEADVKRTLWEKYARQTIKKYEALNVNQGSLSYKKIIELITEYKVPLLDIQFFMDCFGEHMKNFVNKSLKGNDKIESLTIKINLNESRTISKSIKRPDVEGSILRDVPDNVEQEMGQKD